LPGKRARKGLAAAWPRLRAGSRAARRQHGLRRQQGQRPSPLRQGPGPAGRGALCGDLAAGAAAPGARATRGARGAWRATFAAAPHCANVPPRPRLHPAPPPQPPPLEQAESEKAEAKLKMTWVREWVKSADPAPWHEINEAAMRLGVKGAPKPAGPQGAGAHGRSDRRSAHRRERTPEQRPGAAEGGRDTPLLGSPLSRETDGDASTHVSGGEIRRETPVAPYRRPPAPVSAEGLSQGRPALSTKGWDEGEPSVGASEERDRFGGLGKQPLESGPLRKALKRLHEKIMGKPSIQHAFYDFDMNHDNKISLDEFLEACSSMQTDLPKAQLSEVSPAPKLHARAQTRAHSRCARAGRGPAGRGRGAVGPSPLKPPVRVVRACQVFKSMDLNADGFISREEFVKAFEPKLELPKHPTADDLIAAARRKKTHSDQKKVRHFARCALSPVCAPDDLCGPLATARAPGEGKDDGPATPDGRHQSVTLICPSGSRHPAAAQRRCAREGMDSSRWPGEINEKGSSCRLQLIKCKHRDAKNVKSQTIFALQASVEICCDPRCCPAARSWRRKVLRSLVLPRRQELAKKSVAARHGAQLPYVPCARDKRAQRRCVSILFAGRDSVL